MPTTLATLIVPSDTRTSSRVHLIEVERIDPYQRWAFTWAVLTGWALPDVPDDLGAAYKPASAATTGTAATTEGAPACRA